MGVARIEIMPTPVAVIVVVFMAITASLTLWVSWKANTVILGDTLRHHAYRRLREAGHLQPEVFPGQDSRPHNA